LSKIYIKSEKTLFLSLKWKYFYISKKYKMAIDKTIPDKLTDSQKNRLKAENKAKANPKRAQENKEINDRKRAGRLESGSKKVINR
jgi:hypothetical protein